MRSYDAIYAKALIRDSTWNVSSHPPNDRRFAPTNFHTLALLKKFLSIRKSAVRFNKETIGILVYSYIHIAIKLSDKFSTVSVYGGDAVRERGFTIFKLLPIAVLQLD